MNSKKKTETERIAAFCKNDQLEFFKSVSEKVVLQVLHNSPFNDVNSVRGGTEYHVLDIVRNINDTLFFAFFPAIENSGIFVLQCRHNGEFHEMRLKPESGGVYEALTTVFKTLPVSHVHIQHWLSTGPDVFAACRDEGIPYFVTLHDFYCFCGRVNLIDRLGKYCTEYECAQCLNDYRPEEKDRMREYLRDAQRVFAPSAFVKETVETQFEDVEITVIEHGCDRETEIRDEGQKDGILRAAFIGNMQPIKGSEMIERILLQGIPQNIEIHFFGNIINGSITDRDDPAVFFHGGYTKENIQELLTQNKIDIAVFAGICPETYSYTLSEALLAGCGVIAIDLGAVGQRLRNYRCGKLVRLEDFEKEFFGILTQLQADGKKLSELKKCSAHINSVREMALQYKAYYKTIAFKERERYAFEQLERYVANAARKVCAQLYIGGKNGFSEEVKLSAELSACNFFSINFDLRHFAEIKTVRFDPVEGEACSVWISSVESNGKKVRLNGAKHNGIDEDGVIRFESLDPWVQLRVGGKTQTIGIHGFFKAKKQFEE